MSECMVAATYLHHGFYQATRIRMLLQIGYIRRPELTWLWGLKTESTQYDQATVIKDVAKATESKLKARSVGNSAPL